MGLLKILQMADLIHLAVASYNCRGFNSVKCSYVRTLLTKVSVLFLQEHWLSDAQLSVLGDVDDNFLYAGVSGFDNSDILRGRPFGGCAILWRSDLRMKVSILDTASKRVCAVRMVSGSCRLLFVNVYMPFEADDSSTNFFCRSTKCY